MTTTIVLADDHNVVRQGLRALLEVEKDLKVVGEARDGIETLQNVEALGPRVVVLDLMMPGLNGLDVLRQIKKRCPNTQIVILSMYANESDRMARNRDRRARRVGVWEMSCANAAVTKSRTMQL